MSKQQLQKKQPPPRPPPPKFTRYKSISSNSLNQPSPVQNLIEWSPPTSPMISRQQFGGSVSSSYSSSASSLTSNKKSTDSDFSFSLTFNFAGQPSNNEVQISTLRPLPVPVRKAPVPPSLQAKKPPLTFTAEQPKQVTGAVSRLPVRKEVPKPTIIRAGAGKAKTKADSKNGSKARTPNASPPMPNIPPPSPPSGDTAVITPYGIALFNFPQIQPEDLALQIDDIVFILRRVDQDWLYGRVDDREGVFPESYINVEVPLPGEHKVMTALYEFNTNMAGDLRLIPGQKVRILKRINEDWLFGESNGETGQFPANFVC